MHIHQWRATALADCKITAIRSHKSGDRLQCLGDSGVKILGPQVDEPRGSDGNGIFHCKSTLERLLGLHSLADFPLQSGIGRGERLRALTDAILKTVI